MADKRSKRTRDASLVLARAHRWEGPEAQEAAQAEYLVCVADDALRVLIEHPIKPEQLRRLRNTIDLLDRVHDLPLAVAR